MEKKVDFHKSEQIQSDNEYEIFEEELSNTKKDQIEE